MARPPIPLVTPAGETYTPRQISVIALLAEVDPRTVRRHLEGYAQLAPVTAAIRSAMDRVPRPKARSPSSAAAALGMTIP